MELTRAEIKNLKDKKFRKQNALFLLEGEKFCADAVSAKLKILKTITTNKNLKGFPNIVVVDEKTLQSLASTVTPQNIVCVCKIKQPPPKIVGDTLVLDRVQDPGNVGTLIRSALAFGFKNVVLIDSADAFSEKVVRSSAGTILKINVYKTSINDFVLNKTKFAENFLVADMSGERLDKFRLPKGRIAVIIGNEGQGVCAELENIANSKIMVPMSGEVESLNAGVAGSIILQKIFELRGR